MDNVTERKTIMPAENGPDGIPSAQNEFIPGYHLLERIGAGGFGEVWRASAPGGLQKAVKIVYGTMSDRHATAELKSLERIKSVRHPFIITLERIEVLDNKLVVVCELAEQSLRDYFDELVAAGHKGIERARLVGYMHDVADALDYMSDQHSLQHLDIKPENLLIISDHVKVADFGLTKDLRDASLSAVAGMTPAYTAPEVFSGNPGRYSDQYALACVYQFLLTGRPPFQGRSTAELLSQHLYSAADVSLLPVHDQSVVLRALSKNPKRRFASAREFVQALKTAGEEKNRPTVSSTKSANRSGRGRHSSSVETLASRSSDTAATEERSLKPLGPLTDLEMKNVFRPTLVIGLGGMAGAMLQSLKAQLNERFPDGAAPAFKLLAIDTDETALLKRMYEAETGSLSRSECLSLNLRPSSAYHRRFKKLTEWISRRWLFNIPRSRRTEGIRALGRLAFVDHYRDIERTLRQALGEITSQESADQTIEATGMPRRSIAPRVFIVSSTSGGAGSGMIFDMGYAVRQIIRNLGLPDEGVTGILMHDIRSTIKGGEIFIANALACIRELDHYCRNENYTGDISSDIPAMSMARPFDTAYVVPIGRPTGGAQARGPMEAVAEYLFQSFAGPCNGALDHLRATASAGGLMPKVKSFAVSLLDAPSSPVELEGTEPSPSLPHEPEADVPVADELVETSETDTPLAELETPAASLDPFATIPTPITPATMDDELQRIELLVQEATESGEGESNTDESNAADTAAPLTVEEAVASPEVQPESDMQETRNGTDKVTFSAVALFEQLQKTRGKVRMLTAANAAAAAQLEPLIDEPWRTQKTAIKNDSDTTFVCFEVEDIPLCDVIALIERDSPDSAELADELATRIDIDWAT